MVNGVVKRPEQFLFDRTSRRNGRIDRLIPKEGQIAILKVDLTGRDVISNELRFDHTGELTTARSLKVSVFDYRHRCVRITLGTPIHGYFDCRVRWWINWLVGCSRC